MTIHRPFAGTHETPGELVSLTPEDAGWDWTGLRVVRLSPGRPMRLETGPSEVFVLPLRGSLGVEVAHVDQAGSTEAKFDLDGRASVFSAVTDFAYVGRDSVVVLSSDEVAEVAIPAARCSNRLEARYGAASDVPVETRGAGQREPTGQQLRGPRGLGPRREADLLRADHSARQLVELPTAQARRLGALRGGQRGDLLLPDRRLRPGHAVARRRTATTARTPGPSTTRSASSRSTRRSRSATTTSCWSRTATTDRAWPRRATRCTTSTCSPAPARPGDGRSATTRPMPGSGTAGRASRSTRAARSPRRRDGWTASFRRTTMAPAQNQDSEEAP